jgi:hypothetical protein
VADDVRAFEASLNTSAHPPDWHRWVTQFENTESEIHGGTAGVADDRFYASVRKFLDVAHAPPAIHSVVDFHHGLAAWDFAESARAGDVLLAELKSGGTWMTLPALLRGTAISKLESGDVAGAKAIYDSAAPKDYVWSLSDRVILGAIDDRLKR